MFLGLLNGTWKRVLVVLMNINRVPDAFSDHHVISQGMLLKDPDGTSDQFGMLALLFLSFLTYTEYNPFFFSNF